MGGIFGGGGGGYRGPDPSIAANQKRERDSKNKTNKSRKELTKSVSNYVRKYPTKKN